MTFGPEQASHRQSRLKALLPRHWHGPRHRHRAVAALAAMNLAQPGRSGAPAANRPLDGPLESRLKALLPGGKVRPAGW